MMYDQNVGTYYNEGNEDCAYFSLNQCEISCMEIDHGQSVETIEVDDHAPFAIVLPANTGTVRFYDKKGEIVEEISGYGASSVW